MHTRIRLSSIIAICWWHCITALPPISLIQNLCDQNQCQIACTVKQFMVIGIPEVLSQSLPSFRHRLSVVYQKSQNAAEQNLLVKGLNSTDSKIHKLCAIYNTAIPSTEILSWSKLFFVSQRKTWIKELCCIAVLKLTYQQELL